MIDPSKAVRSIKSAVTSKSVTISEPESGPNSKISKPSPPVRVSLCLPPFRISFPDPPIRVSLPFSPKRKSESAPPLSVS